MERTLQIDETKSETGEGKAIGIFARKQWSDERNARTEERRTHAKIAHPAAIFAHVVPRRGRRTSKTSRFEHWRVICNRSWRIHSLEFPGRLAMFRKLASFAAVVCLGLALPLAEANQKLQLNQLMIDKLRFSQLMLQAIALGEFPKIIANAEELVKLSRTSEWLANRTPKFELHSNAFQRAAETVIQKAKAKNLDGVVLAYQDLTMSCVRCHEYLRDVRDARAPMIDPRHFAQR